jgi:hypothetical protein
MNLPTERYVDQRRAWPAAGRHILASFDAETIVVYQAYSRAIGQFAISNGVFGGDFSYRRMSWVKPGFLWMMYRSDWGRAASQEVVLAVRLRRRFFDALLARAVPSSFEAALFPDPDAWRSALRHSDVRLQWDPDHLPSGAPSARRAIQLGLRGASLEAYGTREIVEIADVSGFVAAQRENVAADARDLVIPVERPYLPEAAAVRRRIGLEA